VLTAAHIPFGKRHAVAQTPRTMFPVVRLSDVTPEAVTFLWPQRNARGKLNLLVGVPGLGKTTVALDAVARLSRGTVWPKVARRLPAAP
jgi:hypothetical protein